MAAVCAWLLAACSYRPLSARISDERGQPVPGAVLYVEAWKNSGAYDFCYGTADAQGRVGGTGSDAPRLRAKWGGRMSFTVMAPGYWPIAMVDHRAGVKPDSMFIPRLRPLDQPPRPFDGAPGGEFPFAENSSLRSRAAAPEAAPLRQAFLRAFAVQDSLGQGMSGEARQRMKALQAMAGEAGGG